jgi:predicted transcriptional regulator
MSDSELRVMDVLWSAGPLNAKALAERMEGLAGWNKNTTYTLVKRLVCKGAVERTEPGFLCRPLVDRSEVERTQVGEFVDRLFGGSAARLFAALTDDRKLPPEEVAALKKLIDRMK